MPLTNTAVAQAKPRAKVYRLADGEGLFLQVSPKGGKYWRLRYFIDGKEKMMGLGTYPETSLAEARDKKREARKKVQAGDDPVVLKRQQRNAVQEAAANTFHAVALEWHGKNLAKWTPAHGAKIWRRIEQHLLPDHGKRPISQMKPLEILATIQKLEARGTTEISHRVLQTCSAIFRYALILGESGI